MNAAPERPNANMAASGVWLRPLRDWPQALLHALERAPAIVRVVLIGVRGSAPREPGSCLLVSPDGIEGSIGGGRLEWQAIAAAHSLLATLTAPAARVQTLVLGAELGQCCGGGVDLWIERWSRADLPLLRAIVSHADRAIRLTTEIRHGSTELVRKLTLTGVDGHQPGQDADESAGEFVLRRTGACLSLVESLPRPLPPVWLYGAGHVGQALARILAKLPLALTWIDARAELLPPLAGVEIRSPADPVATVAAAPAGVRGIVMTHDHGLDYRLCRAFLARGDTALVGLIGSASKAARFRSRLARDDGFDAATIARLRCPIGIEGIASKWPAAIAVAVAAEILRDLTATPRVDVSSAIDSCSGGCDQCHWH